MAFNIHANGSTGKEVENPGMRSSMIAANMMMIPITVNIRIRMFRVKLCFARCCELPISDHLPSDFDNTSDDLNIIFIPNDIGWTRRIVGDKSVCLTVVAAIAADSRYSVNDGNNDASVSDVVAFFIYGWYFTDYRFGNFVDHYSRDKEISR